MNPPSLRPRSGRARSALLLSAAAASVIAGCGDERQPRANEPRPALPALVSATLSDGRVVISPARLGAGAVELIVSNRSRRSRTVTVTSRRGDHPVLRTPPIAPGETGRASAPLATGVHVVRAGSRLTPATLTIGASRPSSSDALHTP